MIRAILTSIFACILLPTLAYSLDNCYSCHGQKSPRTYVDRAIFDRSVHGALTCNRCHTTKASYPHGAASKVNCGICHFLSWKGVSTATARDYKQSVHGRAAQAGNAAAPDCQTCHGSHAIFPSNDPRSTTRKELIPALCSTCHPVEFEDYRKSIHGKALLEQNNGAAPSCFDCHLEHLIPKTDDPKWKLALITQCGNCHAEQINTYRKTFHGKVTKLGYATVAKCTDCHGAHTIQPPSNEASLLSARNILATCKKCHPHATTGFTKYYAHAEESNRYKYPVLYYTYLFMTVLLIGVFTFFFTHTFLWAYRSLKERLNKKGGA